MAATEEATVDLEAVMQKLSEVTSTPGLELCFLLVCFYLMLSTHGSSYLCISQAVIGNRIHRSRAISILIHLNINRSVIAVSDPLTHIFALLKAW